MQARVGSTRLTGKILKTIQGKTVLEHDIERCLRVQKADGIVIATTVEPEAERIIEICGHFPGEKVRFYCGSIQDVLSRSYESARMVGALTVIRITSDCPLLDPFLVDSMIAVYQKKREDHPPIDYLCNNMPPTFPHGLDTEILTFGALECAFQEATQPEEREHVTPYIRNHPEIFHLDNFSQGENQSHLRWTLDYTEDFEFIKAVYDHLYPENRAFTRFDVLSLLTKYPMLQQMNQTRCQR